MPWPLGAGQSSARLWQRPDGSIKGDVRALVQRRCPNAIGPHARRGLLISSGRVKMWQHVSRRSATPGYATTVLPRDPHACAGDRAALRRGAPHRLPTEGGPKGIARRPRVRRAPFDSDCPWTGRTTRAGACPSSAASLDTGCWSRHRPPMLSLVPGRMPMVATGEKPQSTQSPTRRARPPPSPRWASLRGAWAWR